MDCPAVNHPDTPYVDLRHAVPNDLVLLRWPSSFISPSVRLDCPKSKRVLILMTRYTASQG